MKSALSLRLKRCNSQSGPGSGPNDRSVKKPTTCRSAIGAARMSTRTSASTPGRASVLPCSRPCGVTVCPPMRRQPSRICSDRSNNRCHSAVSAGLSGGTTMARSCAVTDPAASFAPAVRSRNSSRSTRSAATTAGWRDTATEQPISSHVHSVQPHVCVGSGGWTERVPLYDRREMPRPYVYLGAADHHEISTVTVDGTDSAPDELRVVHEVRENAWVRVELVQIRASSQGRPPFLRDSVRRRLPQPCRPRTGTRTDGRWQTFELLVGSSERSEHLPC
jgi:hypothetical protein